MVSACLALHHPAPEGRVDRNCGVCGSMVLVRPCTVLFLTMNPEVPLLCCSCALLGKAALRAAIPGVEIMKKEVPDLSPMMN